MNKTEILKVRLPADLADVIEREAGRMMITKSTYLRMVVGRALGYKTAAKTDPATGHEGGENERQ